MLKTAPFCATSIVNSPCAFVLVRVALPLIETVASLNAVPVALSFTVPETCKDCPMAWLKMLHTRSIAPSTKSFGFITIV